MKPCRLLLGSVIASLLAFPASAQQLPAGTILPVMSSGTLNSAKTKAGDSVSARLMQDLVLSSGERIRAGAKVQGRVLESAPSRLLLQFDRIVSGGRQYDIATSLRSVASMQDVFNAQLPVGTFDDYGTSVSDWTTVQVGGAAVYLGDQTVRDGMQIVGQAPGYGITRAKLIAAPKRGCPVNPEETQQEQSLWIFSPWACGAYGFEDLTISHHGVTSPVGRIELTASKSVVIRGGSGWLLRIVQPATAENSNSGQ